MMKEIHAERGSAIVMAAFVVISMIGTILFKDDTPVKTDYSVTPFPAYYTENPDNSRDIDNINSAMPFNCKVDWPQEWTLSREACDFDWPDSDLYTPMYIYDGDTPVGYIGFNVFEPVSGDVADREYHKTVWPVPFGKSGAVWSPFTAVLTGFTSQIGIVDIEYQSVTTNGIMAYDTGLKAYVGIAFMPGAVTRDQAIELAKTLRIYAV